MTQLRYSKAPIAEAVIDIHVRFHQPVSNKVFSELQQSISSRFPTINPVRFFEIALTNSDEQVISPQFDQREAGLRLSNSNNSRVLLLRDIGFTYSHLPPYSDWETFRQEAESLWQEFVSVCNPSAVTRCAVRYVNKISVPSERFEASQYFRIYPQIPPEIPQDMVGLFMQLQMPQLDIAPEATALINVALEPPSVPNTATVLLDFDLFRTLEIDPLSPELWETIEKLRTRKNELFEACITDETRGLIK